MNNDRFYLPHQKYDPEMFLNVNSYSNMNVRNKRSQNSHIWDQRNQPQQSQPQQSQLQQSQQSKHNHQQPTKTEQYFTNRINNFSKAQYNKYSEYNKYNNHNQYNLNNYQTYNRTSNTYIANNTAYNTGGNTPYNNTVYNQPDKSHSHHVSNRIHDIKNNSNFNFEVDNNFRYNSNHNNQSSNKKEILTNTILNKNRTFDPAVIHRTFVPVYDYNPINSREDSTYSQMNFNPQNRKGN